jgi:hypothetical protein
LPNYNPIGVTTSHSGQDFAGKAGLLFNQKSMDPETASSGVDDFGMDEMDDEVLPVDHDELRVNDESESEAETEV